MAYHAILLPCCLGCCDHREADAGVLTIITSYSAPMGRTKQEEVMGRTPASVLASPTPMGCQ